MQVMLFLIIAMRLGTIHITIVSLLIAVGMVRRLMMMLVLVIYIGLIYARI